MDQLENRLWDILRGTFSDIKLTLIEQLELAAAQAPDRAVVLEIDRESLSHARLLELTHYTVATLNALGFTTTSRLAIAVPSTAEASTIYPAVMAGMAVVPADPTLPAAEYERRFKQVGVDGVLVKQHENPAAREAAEQLGIPIIEVAYAPDGPVGLFHIVGAEDLPSAAPEFAGPDDWADISATSGTTNLPKLIPKTQRERAIGIYSLAAFGSFVDGDRVRVNLLPIHNAAGLGELSSAIIMQGSFACTPAFETGLIYRYLAAYRPSRFTAPPVFLQAMVNEAPNHAAEIEQLRLREILVGFAALPDQLFHEVQRIFHADIQIVYGSQETHWIAAITQSVDDPAYRPGSVGLIMPYAEVKIVDDGVTLPHGEAGEIVMRSPLMFRGYVNNPEADLALRNGWFHTGDTGYLDADGYLYLTGRLKEVINRGGSKISPTEIDAVLIQHPLVADAGTFGFPHSALGEDVAVAVVLREPGVTEDDLRLFAARGLPTTQVPTRFVFVDAVPRNALGKVDRNLLAARFKDALRR